MNFRLGETCSSDFQDMCKCLVLPQRLFKLFSGENPEFDLAVNWSYEPESKVGLIPLIEKTRGKGSKFLFALIFNNELFGIETSPPFMGELEVSVFIPDNIDQSLISEIQELVVKAYKVLDTNYHG